MATVIEALPGGARSARTIGSAREGGAAADGEGREHGVAARGAADIGPGGDHGRVAHDLGAERGAELLAPQCSDGERSETERNGGASNSDRGGKTTPRAGGGVVPDPEVSDRPTRRRFTTEYKRRVLRLIDASAHGEVAALLRREGLYSSHIAGWRKEQKRAELHPLPPAKRGPTATRNPTLVAENQRLLRENRRLERRLRQAETMLEVQKKVSELLGIHLNSHESDENA